MELPTGALWITVSNNQHVLRSNVVIVWKFFNQGQLGVEGVEKGSSGGIWEEPEGPTERDCLPLNSEDSG